MSITTIIGLALALSYFLLLIVTVEKYDSCEDIYWGDISQYALRPSVINHYIWKGIHSYILKKQLHSTKIKHTSVNLAHACEESCIQMEVIYFQDWYLD